MDEMRSPATIAAMSLLVRVVMVLAVLGGGGVLHAQDDPAAPGGAAPAAGVDPKSLTASELYDQGRAAYANGEFALCEALLSELVASYGQNPDLKKGIDAVRPLIALAQVRQKKFGEALPSIEETLKMPELPSAVVSELEFWKGLCFMQLQSYTESQIAFGEFYKKHYESKKRSRRDFMRAHEALILFAVGYVMQGNHSEAADFLLWQLPKLRRESKEAGARATVLLLHSLMQSNRLDDALELIKVQFADLSEVTQLISLQSMALEVGSKFLEQGEYYKAIACLQRIWQRDRLLRHQRDRLAELEEKLEILKRRRGMEDFVFQYEGVIRRVNLELEAFEKVVDYDAALRLRLANAFVGMQRYWEAALVLEDMLVNMPAGPVVEQASLSWIQSWMQCERWDKAIEAADIYLAKFENSDQDDRVPLVLMMKGDAFRKIPDKEKARAVYGEVVERFPTGNLAPRALFMQGILFLEEDKNDEAVAIFADVRKRFSKHPMAEDAHYWTGMAHSFAKEYQSARDVLFDYLEVFGEKARYRIDARFRTAFCAHAAADYEKGIEELSTFLKEDPGSAYESEAEILLGDGLLSVGRMEEGIASYRAIDPSDTRFFEESVFKTGKALRLFATSISPTEIDEAFIARLIGLKGEFGRWWKETGKGELASAVDGHFNHYSSKLDRISANPGKAFGEWIRRNELLAEKYKLKAGDEIDLKRRKFPQAVYEEWWARAEKKARMEVAKLHFERFAAEHPKSARMPEAVYWLGWAHRQDGDEEKAREIYWSTIRAEGNDPKQQTVQSLFQGLQKLYRSAGENDQWLRELDQLARDAEAAKKPTLQLWAHWARATGAGGSEKTIRSIHFDRAARLCDPSEHSPAIVADCADFLRGEDRPNEAKKLYAGLRKWNPRAVERERAYFGLASIASKDSEWDEAVVQLEKLRDEGVSPALQADGQMLLATIQLQRDDRSAARATYEALLEDKFAPARTKGEALVALGGLLSSMNEKKKAAAYFERVYIGYGRYPDLVAKAYRKRGQLLEDLGMPEKAVEVYTEMTGRADLEDFPETGEARTRLKELAPGKEAEA